VTPGPWGGPVDPFDPPYLPSQLLSLGVGGSLTVRFDTPITNDPANPFGLDFLIFGSAGFVITNNDFTGGGITDGSLFAHNTGQTRVSVSANGLTYYLLDPAKAPTVDALFPTDSIGDFSRPVNPTLASPNFSGLDLVGIRSLYAGSGGGAGYDLGWALDGQNRTVTLPSVSFVRVDVIEGRSEIDAFGVVPEPACWELMAFGAGILWLLCPRRQPRPTLLPRLFFRAQSILLARPRDDLDRAPRTRSHPDPVSCPRTRQRLASGLMCALAVASPAQPATITEDFAVDPLARGWATFGDASLFRWNPTAAALEVTWDSSRPNSYWFRQLGTILTKNDDFQVAFDLQLQSVLVGTTADKPFTFELAIGLLNMADAMSPSFARGVGTRSPNLVEFDYFPDSGYGATIWPTIISTNSRFSDSFSGTYSYTLAEMTAGDWFHVALMYTASNQVLTTLVQRNGLPFGPIKPVHLSSNFTNFHLDAVAISSYSDAGADGSILAQGVVDNLALIVPDPPNIILTGSFANTVWQVSFATLSNWVYYLERTEDWLNWTLIAAPAHGTGAALHLSDAESRRQAFYRVRAERP
jgi:hypothetical protein